MNSWEIFWTIVIVFSVLSFTYMSVKMIYFGWSELKDMFKLLSEEHLQKRNEMQ